MTYRAPSLLKPLLACWVIAGLSVLGAIYYVSSFYRDQGHPQEYLVGAVMVLSWTVPASLIVSVGSVIYRRRFSRASHCFLNLPTLMCAIVIVAINVAPAARAI